MGRRKDIMEKRRDEIGERMRKRTEGRRKRRKKSKKNISTKEKKVEKSKWICYNPRGKLPFPYKQTYILSIP